jgi:glyoxylase-like metal-dependent hydrolase (beta-lactamase superfamily II)
MERIVLPTPFPVGPVNVWLLRGDPLTLVDAGPSTPEALTALERGLGELGVRLEEIEQLVLTHQHSDHVGLAATVVERSGCRVAGHELLVDYVRDTQASIAGEEAWQDSLLRLHGTPDERREAYRSVMLERRPYTGIGAVVDLALAEDDVLEAGGLRLRVSLRPGHSPTDTIFCDDATGIALVGDHLIAHISSNPLVSRPLVGPADPVERVSALASYVSSLERTAAEDHALMRTGHGVDIEGHRALIAERIRLHERRVEQVGAALDGRPRTAADLSTQLWPGLPPNQTFLTLCEVLGALDLLEERGRVRKRLEGETLAYEPV